jgi:two-component system nitrate/nitrite response regulator NarL
MNNASVTRLASNNSPSSTSDMSKRLPNPVEVISEIKQIGASVPLAAIGHDANNVDVPRIDSQIRKGINQSANGTARLRK